MRNIRRFLGAIVTLVLCVAMGSAAAQNVKYFTLGAPASVGVSSTTIQVTFKNIENGNSSFNSIGIKGTTAGGATLAISGGTASPGGPGTPSTSGGYFFLTGLAPVKKGETLTVTLNVAMSGNGCTNGGITWHGRAFTGSPSSPSTEFQQQNADPVTVVSMGCAFSATGTTPATMIRGTTGSLSINVANAATSSVAISSVTLTPPAAISTPGTNYAVAINPGTNANVTVTGATASCDSSKADGAWGASVSGFPPAQSVPSTALTGNCGLKFSGAPTSVVAGEPFTISVQALDGAGGVLPGYTGSVTLVSTGTGCTIVGTNPVTASGGTALFNVTLNVDATTTTCTLKGSASIDGKSFDTPSLTLAVFDGVLGCSPATFDALDLPSNVAGSFDASQGGAANVGDPGFVAGIRGSDPDKGVCANVNGDVKINYAVFNNIPAANTSNLTDPLANIVRPGFYSVTWDASQVDPLSLQLLKPVFAIIATYRPEAGDPVTGLPVSKTLICTVSPCTSAPYSSPGVINTPDWKPALACLSTLVKHSSIPTGEKGCVASERWDVVPVSQCSGSPARCLKPTSVMIMGDDPVFGR